MIYRSVLLTGLLALALAPGGATASIIDYGAKPNDQIADTAAIQANIDACAAKGGEVVIPKGKFITGALRLRNRTHLRLLAGAELQGSLDWRDYGTGDWNDAMINGQNLRDIVIEGPGTIDGRDCPNPKGEEGFRGPHVIRLVNCTGVTVRNITINNSSNYAVYNVGCSKGQLSRVTINAGHDGLHAQACVAYTVTGCRFATGDDCVAGCDSQDFRFTDCTFNSSCNAFRFGCLRLYVGRCAIEGPGRHPHRISHRTNMLAAFAHFAPDDRHPKLPSDQWLIQDVTVKNVECLYNGDYLHGGWQTGQPPKRLRFVRVKADSLIYSLFAVGNLQRQLELTFEDCSLTNAPGASPRPVIDVTNFGGLTLRRVALQNGGGAPAVRARDGNQLLMDHVRITPPGANDIDAQGVGAIHR